MDKLGGDGMTIEIDESKFGKRKYNRGHRVEGVWVLGMVERSERGRVKLVVVEDRKKSTLHDIIKESIKADSVIYTDGWRGYNDLEESFQSHMTVNHSKHFKDPETQVHTNTIEGTWNGVKIGTPARGRAKTKIQRYILRYMLIKNEKKDSLDVLLNYLLYFINFLFLFLQK